MSVAAIDRYNAEVHRRMEPTVWNLGGCSSWYQDGHGRNPTLWPDFTWRLVRGTRRFDASAYQGVIQKVSSPT